MLKRWVGSGALIFLCSLFLPVAVLAMGDDAVERPFKIEVVPDAAQHNKKETPAERAPLSVRMLRALSGGAIDVCGPELSHPPAGDGDDGDIEEGPKLPVPSAATCDEELPSSLPHDGRTGSWCLVLPVQESANLTKGEPMPAVLLGDAHCHAAEEEVGFCCCCLSMLRFLCCQLPCMACKRGV